MLAKSLYMKTSAMAQILGYHGDYLLKNRGVLFFEEIHYFPKDKRIDWKVSEMISWVENKNLSTKAKEILDLVS